MQAHQNCIFRGDLLNRLAEIAIDQGNVRLGAIHLALVGDHAEVAVGGRQGGLGDAVDIALVL